MKFLIAALSALSLALFATVWELESQPPEVVYVQPEDELPWAIFIDVCGSFAALIWTTEPPTWFMPDDSMNAEQVAIMQRIMNAEQWQLANLTAPICTQKST